jgi:hypothetical protein
MCAHPLYNKSIKQIDHDSVVFQNQSINKLNKSLIKGIKTINFNQINRYKSLKSIN